MTVKIGPLDVSLVAFPLDGRALYVDWHMERVGNRRRLVLALHDIYVPLSERQGIRPGPYRFRVGPLRGAWYGKGVE